MNRKIYGLLLLLAFLTAGVAAQNTIIVTDASLTTDTVRWTKNNTYLLDGYVYLEAGGVLIIEPGTVIKAKTVPTPPNTNLTSALIITKGAKIFANGTANNPIIFTGEIDDLSTTTDLTASDNQTWGGLLILGNAPVGEDGGADFIEGIPSGDPRNFYGGTNPNDNSGVLKYVSIRHAGSVIGADNEINGLTLGGVGNGTVIDYIEIFANFDDGIEFFGGTVNVKHAVVAFCGDDSFDFDESWAGTIQFAFGLVGTTNGVGELLFEYDGSEEANRQPKTIGKIYNGTFIGGGKGGTNTSSRGLRLREDASAQFWNCIWTDVADYMFRIEGTSVDRLAAGESAFAANIIYNYGTLNNGSVAALTTALGLNNNQIDVNPQLAGIARTPNGGLDPRPNAGSPALSGALFGAGDNVEQVSYRGAFSNTNNWARKWTALDQYGYFGNLVTIPTSVITDESIEAGDTLILTADREWILDGYVYVEENACIIIEPGTVVKGRTVPSTGDLTSALIITRDGCIKAEGTANNPIIFTGEIDDLSTTTDLTASDNQTWGGLIILGDAPVGEDGGSDVIEGIPSDEPRIRYGGNEPNDNSGILKYVSIRHGGSVIGADNEINGLSLGGVGNGTVIDYIEIFANFDDGIEFFGGTVNVKHAVVGFVGDDAFDFDESWAGNIQYAFGLVGTTNGVGELLFEYDGSEEANRQPKTIGKIYNGTFIGGGKGGTNTSSRGLRLREDASAQFWNCIWTDVADYMFRIEGTSVNRLAAGESAFAANIIYNYGTLNNGNVAALTTALGLNNNQIDVNPQLAGIARTPIGGLDPRPNAGSPALGTAINDPNAAAIIDDVNYVGAFSNTNNWARRWTAMDEYGYFGNLVTLPTSVITDESIEAGDTLTLTADREWILDGYVYVEENACIIIEPGTVVKGRTVPSTGDLTSALIITRDGCIKAEGTANAPIIFTGEVDDLNSTTDLTASDNQTWGGLIILGDAPVGEDGGSDVIEGIPSDEPRIRYGGNEPNDNSGILKYVSIRHGGSVIGADNEINGLSLGGVGNGTEIDYIEIFANFDDGIEFFGGTVNVKHAVVGFVGDDAFDFDESWAGTIQFAFGLVGTTNGVGELLFEYDGSEEANRQPKTIGKIYNGTFIGGGKGGTNTSSRGLRLREDAAAQFWNCIWTDVADYMFRIEGTSVNRLAAGESAFAANIIYNYGTLNNGNVAALTTALGLNNNQIDVDPMLGGISRIPNGGLDPRPNAGSPALSGALFGAGDNVQQVTYRGAFNSSADGNWALNWTAMDDYGYFGNLATSVDFAENASGLKMMTPYPNPATAGTVRVDFTLPGSADVTLHIYDFTGRKMSTTVLGNQLEGTNNATLDVSTFQTGMYVIALESDFGTITQKFTVSNRK